MQLRRRPITIAFTAAVVALLACGSDSSDPKTACSDTCEKGGFGGSRVETKTNETNCICQVAGGAPTFTADRCRSYCKAILKEGGTPYKTAGGVTDACRCTEPKDAG